VPEATGGHVDRLSAGAERRSTRSNDESVQSRLENTVSSVERASTHLLSTPKNAPQPLSFPSLPHDLCLLSIMLVLLQSQTSNTSIQVALTHLSGEKNSTTRNGH